MQCRSTSGVYHTRALIVMVRRSFFAALPVLPCPPAKVLSNTTRVLFGYTEASAMWLLYERAKVVMVKRTGWRQ